MGLRERKKQEKWSKIVQAADTLFRERGVDGTTTKSISDAAGIATGTLFLYAKTKEDLVGRIVSERVAAVLQGRMSQLPGATPVADLMFVFSGLLDLFADNLELSKVFLQHATFRGDEIHGEVKRQQDAFLRDLGALVMDMIHPRHSKHAAQLSINLYSLYTTSAIAVVTRQMPNVATTRQMLERAIKLQLNPYLS